MSIAIKRNTSFAVEIEDTEGTYKAPTAATSFVQTLDSGAEISPAKQLLTRKIFTASIGETSPLVGESQVTATMPCEARASSTEGHAPECGKLMQSAFGAVHTVSTTTISGTGNTDSVLQIADADITKYQIGDIVMIKKSGAFHVSPIIDIDTTPSAANFTLLVPHPDGSLPDNVVISKTTTYNVADTGHPSLSVSKYVETAVLEKAVGCRVKDLSLDNFSTGQLPSFKFGMEGLDFGRSLTSRPYTPSYDTSLPPIVLDGRMYMDGASFDVNKFTIAMTNSLGFQTSVQAPNGRIAGRATERTIKGTIDPYKTTDNVDNFTKYNTNTAFSLFAYAKVPTATAGEFGQVVAVYCPNCIITEMSEADQDGLLQDNISFSANRGSSGTIPEIYIAFI